MHCQWCVCVCIIPDRKLFSVEMKPLYRCSKRGMWGLWKTSSTVFLALHPSWTYGKVCVYLLCEETVLLRVSETCWTSSLSMWVSVYTFTCASCHQQYIKVTSFCVCVCVCVCVCDPSGRFSAVITPCGVQWSLWPYRRKTLLYYCLWRLTGDMICLCVCEYNCSKKWNCALFLSICLHWLVEMTPIRVLYPMWNLNLKSTHLWCGEERWAQFSGVISDRAL